MLLLKPAGRERIRKAVEQAEKNTGGEILTAIIPESDDYRAQEMAFGVICALLTYILMVVFFTSFIQVLDRLFWTDSPRMIPLSMMAVTLFVGALGYTLAQIPFIDRLIIGKKTMQEAVRRRAMRHFVESAAYDTIDRTGIMLFISVMERRVELLADKGINEKVSPETWESIVNSLVKGIREKKVMESMEAAIADIGKILSEHVPPRPDDTNEISDAPTELGKGS